MTRPLLRPARQSALGRVPSCGCVPFSRGGALFSALDAHVTTCRWHERYGGQNMAKKNTLNHALVDYAEVETVTTLLP